jgi:hypothetical protein
LAAYLILMLPGMWLGALLASALYQLVRRVDVSFILFAALAFISLSAFVSDLYLLRWINPLIPVLSDDFSNARIFSMALYNRLFWFLLLGGFWILTLLCVRRYERGALRSFVCNARNIALPLAAVCLLTGSGAAYTAQPFVDHSPLEPVWADTEINDVVYLEKMHADVKTHPLSGALSGRITYTIRNTASNDETCVMEINPGYKIKGATLNGASTPFIDHNNDEDHSKQVSLTVPAGFTGALVVDYAGMPQEWAMSRRYMWSEEISSRYIYLRNDTIAPRLNVSRDAPPPFTCDIVLPSHMTFAASGDAPQLLEERGKEKTWRLTDLSGARGFILYAADYMLETFEEAGMAIEFYYSRNHKEIMDRLGAMDMIRHVLNYCADHYGPLRFTPDYPLKLVQETAYAMGGGAFSNFSVMGETTFSEETLNDAARGANGAEVLAHEIIHQWWGLTWMMWDEDEWSSEGLTCYTTYRLMKELHGEDYARAHYVDVWQKEYDTMMRSFYYRNPDYVDILPEKYAADIRMSHFSTRLYNEMPLKLLKAAELLGSEDQLDAVLAKLFQNTDSESYPYIYYDEFLSEAGLTREELSLD